MTFDLNQAFQVLKRTPSVVRSLLLGLDDFWVLSNYGPDTFSPFDVVGHLIHGERTDWMVRVRCILEHEESTPFEPFDRYAQYEASKGMHLSELLQTFAELREKNLKELQSLCLNEKMLNLRGTHPALGPVTLSQLLAAWVAHDLNHIHQIAKAMAFQYRKEVGPWREYLTILPTSLDS